MAGRRVLGIGGPHDVASEARGRIGALGAAASVNLTSSVTDVVLLTGGQNDPRTLKAPARQLELLS